MLRQRIITATVLLAILIPVLLLKDFRAFSILTLVSLSAGAWEWARLNGGGPLAPAFGVLLGVVCAGMLWSGWVVATPAGLWWAAMLLWVLGGALALRGGVAGWPRLPQLVRWVVGFVALWAAWLAMSIARERGLNFILSIFAMVWSADVFAYFGGKAFGRRKLAPAISPGKSWEGVWSGMAGALVVAGVWLWGDAALAAASPSLFTVVAQRYGLPVVALVVVFLVAVSVMGDLFESLVKRSAGAKDSSGLLPGHGGVLDRIDALLPVFPIALALANV